MIAGLVVVAVAVAAVVVVLLPGTSNKHPTRPPVPRVRLFSADSVWNRPLPDDSQPGADSVARVNELINQVRVEGAWIDTYNYSVPVYTVDANQPTVKVVLDTSGGSADELAAVFRAGVPIPPDATAAPGTDQHMVVLQPSTDTMWEFWHMHQVDGVWHASWGGKMTHISSNPGYFTDPPDWGATASSIPLLAGLMRLDEVRSGQIDHALALAIPHASAAHLLPAQRSDGSQHGPASIPEGTIFRIRPGVDLDSLHLPAMTLMMARAVQRYGMIVRDQSGSVTFYGEQVPAGAPNPYYGKHGAFQGEDPASLLRDFPWHDLTTVAPPGPSSS